MKIQNIQIDILKRNIPKFYVNDERKFLGGEITQGVLRIINSDGVEGNSLIGIQNQNMDEQISSIKRNFIDYLLNKKIIHPELIWGEIKEFIKSTKCKISDYAPIDIALWDLHAKTENVSVSEMLGNTNKSVECYITFPPLSNNVSSYTDEAKQVGESNFHAYKIHPGALDKNQLFLTLDKIRLTLGEDFYLMLDPNSRYDYQTSLDIGNKLDELNFFWFEDPMYWKNWDDLKSLNRILKTPITISDDKDFFQDESILFMEKYNGKSIKASSRKYGITGLIEISKICNKYNAKCEVGLAGNNFSNAANLHVISSINNCSFYENWFPKVVHEWGTKDLIITNEDGSIKIPNKKGIGLELDEEWIDFHREDILRF